ncbi:MAG: O-antigen ligase family protein, partial [Anaerolineae bacterium]|nr:O-antigen ligase family protein [Anaerolineae bacterium]
MLHARFSAPSLYFAAAVVIGTAGAVGVAFSPSPAVAVGALAAAPALLIALCRAGERRVELLIFGIVVLCSTIIDIDQLPLVPIGIGSLNPADLFLLLLGGLVALRALRDRQFRWASTPLTLPLLVFFAFVLVSCVVALDLESGTRHRMLSEVRTLAFLLLGIVIPQLVRRRSSFLFLLRGLTVLAAGCALIMIAQAFLGPDIPLIPARLVSVNTGIYAETGLFRVTPPAQALIRTVLILVACEWLLTEPSRRPWWLLPMVALMVVGLLVTANRNYWLGTAFSLALAMTFIDARRRWAMIQSGLKVVIGGFFIGGALILLLELAHLPFAQQLIETTLLRLDPDSSVAGTESSLATRQEEFYYIFRHIEAHPILGIGLGAAYKPPRWYETPANNRTYYTH